MNRKEYEKFARNISHEIAKTREAGQLEYAEEDNVFADFIETAELTGTTPKNVLFTFLNKHMRGIASYLKGHKSQREHISGRIKDAIVYLQLLWAMIHEEERKHKQPNKGVKRKSRWTTNATILPKFEKNKE